MPDYIPKKDLEYQDWLQNFITVGNANLAILGLTTADLTPISTDKTQYDAAITDAEAKAAASKSATTKKNLLRKSSESKARAIVKRIQAKQDVPADIKRLLQINVPGSTPPSPVIPYPPADLVANVIGTGTYELSWKRNGNSMSVNFIIEALFQNAVDFIQIYSTTKSTYIHANNPPGLKISYRVKTQRSELFSTYSNVVSVNDVVIPPVTPV